MLPLIRVRHLSYTYLAHTPMAVAALHDVSFDVEAGEFVAILGPTGSGKSTLVQHLNGLLRPRPGTVWVNGQDLGDRRTDLRKVRVQVGLLFQYPEHQLFEETVFQDVAFGPRSMGLAPDEVEQRVRRALAWVGLDADELGGRSPFELSGGQKRRVAMAGVLALGCQALVLDEPTAGLDPGGRRELLDLLVRLNRRGMTIVMVTHDMDEAARVARRALVLADGRVVADAPVRELFAGSRELLQRYGLDVPAVVDILHQLRARGAPVRVDRLTVDEAAREIAAWKLGRPATVRDGVREGGAGPARRHHHRPVRRG